MKKAHDSSKVIAAISILALVLAGYAVYRSRSVQSRAMASSALDGIRRNKIMRVGYVRFAPCADINPRTQQVEGIFVDAIREVANDMKMQVEFKETTLATFAGALEAGEFDFSIGATFITPMRSVAVDFTRPLLALGNSGLVKKENAGTFTTTDVLGRPGVRIAVLQGQAMEQFVRSKYPNANLAVIAGSDLTAPLSAVEAGQADIGLTNSVTVQQYAASHPNTSVVFTDENALSRLALAWVVKSGDVPLREFLNSSIEWLRQSGKLEAIQNKYSVRLSKLN
jgi:polar amino acid transport system substrate-binding protein